MAINICLLNHESSREGEGCMNKFTYKLSLLQFLKVYIGSKILSWLHHDVKKSKFVRVPDTISYAPMLNELHDGPVCALITQLAREGYSDYYADIGANIGLIAIEVMSDFTESYLVEPNELCCGVLRVNISMNYASLDNLQIFNYGLGEKEGSLVLKIPMHNWGGAFVANAENVYSNEDIARKEGLRSIELLETHEQRIKIVEAEKFFREHVFHNGGLAHNRSGVIKIDVEGYEEVVLRGIASSLPCSSSVCIIFENWNANLKTADILQLFSDREVELLKVESRKIIGGNQRLFKALNLLLGYGRTYCLSKISADDKALGEFLLKIG